MQFNIDITKIKFAILQNSPELVWGIVVLALLISLSTYQWDGLRTCFKTLKIWIILHSTRPAPLNNEIRSPTATTLAHFSKRLFYSSGGRSCRSRWKSVGPSSINLIFTSAPMWENVATVTAISSSSAKKYYNNTSRIWFPSSSKA